MKQSESAKPIRHLKHPAAEALRTVTAGQQPLALLKILAQSNANLRDGRSKPADVVFAQLHEHAKKRRLLR